MRHPRSAVLFTLMSTLAAAVAVALGTVVPVSNVADERPVLEPAALRASSQTALASFEENRGQHDPRVRFMARGANFSVYLTPAEAVYVLPVSTAPPAERTNFALRMAMAGARADAPLSGEAPQTRRVNYLRGNDPSAWVSDAPTFGRVRQHDVYDGVDVVWYANDAGTLEYDFEVAPARNPQAIEIAIDGASRVEIAEDGELWMHTDAGVLKQARPIAYQERDGARVEISSAYEIRDGGRVELPIGRLRRFAGAGDRPEPQPAGVLHLSRRQRDRTAHRPRRGRCRKRLRDGGYDVDQLPNGRRQLRRQRQRRQHRCLRH